MNCYPRGGAISIAPIRSAVSAICIPVHGAVFGFAVRKAKRPLSWAGEDMDGPETFSRIPFSPISPE
jgi:hypothetical protein